MFERKVVDPVPGEVRAARGIDKENEEPKQVDEGEPQQDEGEVAVHDAPQKPSWRRVTSSAWPRSSAASGTRRKTIVVRPIWMTESGARAARVTRSPFSLEPLVEPRSATWARLPSQ